MKHWKAVVVLGGSLVFTVALLYSQGRAQNVDWPVYGGSPGSTRYSSLKPINQSNVSQLQVAWTYDDVRSMIFYGRQCHTGDLRDRRATVHRHRRERCRGPAQSAEYPCSAAGGTLHRLCAAKRLEVTANDEADGSCPPNGVPSAAAAQGAPNAPVSLALAWRNSHPTSRSGSSRHRAPCG
jgi:hypothetical protein